MAYCHFIYNPQIAKSVEHQLLKGNVLRAILEKKPVDEIKTLLKRLQLTAPAAK